MFLILYALNQNLKLINLNLEFDLEYHSIQNGIPIISPCESLVDGIHILCALPITAEIKTELTNILSVRLAV